MSSFKDVVNNLVTTLQNDSDMSTFCKAKWNKNLSVKKVFKERNEINYNDLPIILITRPSIEKSFRIGGDRENKNIVRLYCGFLQNDKRQALDEFIEFEEIIDDVLLKDSMRGNYALDTDPVSSINDEGKYHPIYFMVMDVEILQYRIPENV